MTRLHKCIHILILLGLVSGIVFAIYQSHFCTPQPRPGRKELEAIVASYGWHIHDIAEVGEGVIVWYFYDSPYLYRSHDAQWPKGFARFVTWVATHYDAGFLLVRVINVDAWDAEAVPVEYVQEVMWIIWTRPVMMDYLMRPSEFIITLDIMNQTRRGAKQNLAAYDIVLSLWKPHPEGLWAHLLPREHEVRWNHRG